MPKLTCLKILFCFLLPSLAWAEELLNYKFTPLKLSITEASSAQSAELTLTLDSEIDTSFTIRTLANPARIVIDASGPKSGQAGKSEIKSSKILKSVRVGIHPDKVRFVLDLVGETIPEYFWKPGDKSARLVVKLNPSEIAAPGSAPQADPTSIPTFAPTKIPAQVPSPPTLPAPTPVPLATSTAIATSTAKMIPPTNSPTPVTPAATPTPKSTQTPRPTKTPAPIITPKPAPSAAAISLPSVQGGQTLQSIEFAHDAASKAPLLKLTLSQRAEFKLDRKDDRAFRLTLSKCGLKNKQLLFPQFPPHDFIGLTFVMIEPKGENIEIIIGVERGIKVSAVPKDKEILVRTVNR